MNSFMVKVYYNLVLFSAHQGEVLFDLLFSQCYLAVNAAWTTAIRGAFETTLLAPTIVVIAITLAVATLFEQGFSVD